ncbi:RanBP2-type zinc finger protein [Camellia lanceoleosa]|nr:RanBP2-type zinc finger protein [Camellia lanceoleosa]
MSEKEKMDKENTHAELELEEKNKEREVTEREDGKRRRKRRTHAKNTSTLQPVCHRELLVSIRFNEPGWQWSGCFLPDHLSNTQVKMQNHVSCNKMIRKSAAKPIQPMRVYLSSAPYVGFGAPSSMYMGVPPYGSSLFNGSSMSPYDDPFSGGSAYPYNYGSRLSGGSPQDVRYATPDGPLWLGYGYGHGPC